MRRGIALASPSTENLNSQISKKLTFFGLVGIVMAALSLKEKWDAYREVPSEPGSSPLAGPPSYRDEENEIGLEGLDTEIPATRRRRGRKSGCCVCCGIDCSILWKSIGIVILLFVLWNGAKFIFWAATPSPTGLENMPEFSTSLGCLDAPFLWGDEAERTWKLTPDPEGKHLVEILGGIGGTVTLAPASNIGDEVVTIKTTVRAGDKAGFDGVVAFWPIEGDTQSFWRLGTPTTAEFDFCTRYDVVVYIPSTLKSLTLKTQSSAQVQFSDAFSSSPRTLESLEIFMNSISNTDVEKASDLLLPNAHLAAIDMTINMRSGYLVGEVAVINSTTVDARLSSVVSKAAVISRPYSSETPAHLKTTTGFARSDFTYTNVAHRGIQSVHESVGGGDLYLTYTDAQFSGQVDLQATSYTAKGLQGTMMRGRTGELPWVGDEKGADRMKVSAQGWVGLYF